MTRFILRNRLFGIGFGQDGVIDVSDATRHNVYKSRAAADEIVREMNKGRRERGAWVVFEWAPVFPPADEVEVDETLLRRKIGGAS